jgi:PAS domain S-box-containing protein
MHITLHNQAFHQMNQELGLETRAIGRTPFELFPFLPASVRGEYQQVFAEGKVLITYDETHIGSLSVHTETRKIPIFEDDQVTHVATVMRDITEQKRSEEALRESEEKFRVLVNSMDDVIFTLDSDQRHTGVYGQWVEQLGFTREVFLGKTSREILGEAAASVHEQANTRALAGEHVVYEWSVPAGDEIRHYQTSLSPLRDAEGRVTGLVGVGRDITDIRRVEEALRESQRRYDMATSAGRVGVWDWGLITGELYLDSSLKAILGYAEDEILDQVGDWVGHVHPDDLQRLVEAAQQHRTAQTPSYEVEHRVIRKDKSLRWLLTRGTALRDADNKAYRIVGTSTDITERKRAEQEILALAIEKERSAILAGFVQDVSHEFANPLSVIKNSLYLALNTPDPARRARHMDVIGGQVYHVEKLVEGLLTMSRLDSGFPFRSDPVDLNRLLLAVVEHSETAVQQKGLTLVTELAELPSSPGDQNYLNLAFRHLVENAIQYTPPGGTITIRTAQRGEQALVEIIDTGIGIAPEHLDAVFQRFFRVERARTERGAGLGLPIARMIIERHGGLVEVESTPGAGSTFRVFLPFGG